MPKHFNYLSLCFMVIITIRGYPHNHFMSGHRIHTFMFGNIYIFTKSMIIRYNKTKILSLLIITYHLGIGTFNNPYNLSFLTFSRSNLRLDKLNYNSITMQCTIDMTIRNKIILIFSFNGNKTKTSVITCKYSGLCDL